MNDKDPKITSVPVAESEGEIIDIPEISSDQPSPPEFIIIGDAFAEPASKTKQKAKEATGIVNKKVKLASLYLFAMAAGNFTYTIFSGFK